MPPQKDGLCYPTGHDGVFGSPPKFGHIITAQKPSLPDENHNYNKKYDDIILQPFDYYLQLPSKNIRKRIADIFNYWYKCEPNELDEMSKAMQDLHNASLIIDDIEDGSDLRRGKPAAHIRYGLPLSLNAANYVYFEAMKRIVDAKGLGAGPEEKLKAVMDFINGMMLMHVGQGMEIFWRDENLKLDHSDVANIFKNIPTEEEYFKVIVQKTAEQFSMLADMLKDRSNTLYKDKAALSTYELAQTMGYHFQIRDDLLNLISNTYEAGKGYCEDITEGKYSFPIIYALNQYKDQGPAGLQKASRLLQIMRMRTTDLDLKKEAFQIIQESGAFEYTKRILRVYHKKIGREVLRLGGNPVFRKYIDIFSEVM